MNMITRDESYVDEWIQEDIQFSVSDMKKDTRVDSSSTEDAEFSGSSTVSSIKDSNGRESSRCSHVISAKGSGKHAGLSTRNIFMETARINR